MINFDAVYTAVLFITVFNDFTVIVEDLIHKLENAEEDIVFLQGDISDLKENRSETELRLKAELTALQAELASISKYF